MSFQEIGSAHLWLHCVRQVTPTPRKAVNTMAQAEVDITVIEIDTDGDGSSDEELVVVEDPS